jgi:anaerobic magnesium-protoporphyrin IX monomethyl ester cyclase
MQNSPAFKPAAPTGDRQFKVCLISLYSSSSIGLRYLTSVLKGDGFHVDLIFFKEKNIALDLMETPTPREYDLLLRLLAGLEPDLIGIGVRSSFFKIAGEITQRIQRDLGRRVIWGGTHPTVAPEQSVEIADWICLGEGEPALLELARELSSGRDGGRVQNIWARESGGVTKNPIRPLLEDLNSLPFPDFGGENKYYIQDDQVADQDPGLQAFNLDVLTSRGCPYHCSYCSNSLFHSLYKGKGDFVRLRSVGNVIDEIETQRKLFPKLKRIDFIDEVFSWNKEWVEEFVDVYTKKIALPFHCMQHPIKTDKGIMKMLKDAGLERVEIGIQSGSERIRKELFQRYVSDEQLIQTSRIMSELRITPFYDVIVDNPFETVEDKRQGLELLLKISRPYYMHMFSLIYFPNTKLTRKALEDGVINEGQVEGNSTRTFDQMYVSLKHPRTVEDRFWISLYSLTSKRFVPRKLIRRLGRVRYLEKRPGPLVLFASLCNTIKLAAIAAKWLLEGKPVFASLGKRKTSEKQGNRII